MFGSEPDYAQARAEASSWYLSAVIAGAQKSGTTSLLRYLSQHPQLCGHAATEFTFFDDAEYRRSWRWAKQRYFYDCVWGQQLIAKYAALAQSEELLGRLAEHSPGCRIILILRDPVQRAFSSYRMERSDGSVVRPFEYILTRLAADQSDPWKRMFVDFGDYPAALRRVHNHFGPAQVTVLIYEEFVAHPVSACRRIFEQLGVDVAFVPDTSVAHNAHRGVRSQVAASGLRWLRRPTNPIRRTARRLLHPRKFTRLGERLLEANRGLYSAETVDPEVAAALADYYRPLNEELEALLGRDLALWTGMARPGRAP